MEFRHFCAGSIHDPKVFEFWQQDLQASTWVLNTLKNGYLIPFRSNPGPYEERNNKSVRENMQVVRGILAEMIQSDIIYIVKKRPTCINPLGLVTKTLEDGSVKHRLVLDVSRHVNLHIEVPHVRLSHLDKAIEITQENDFQLVFDLVSAYYHVKIDPAQHQFLGACFENSDGSKVYVQYAHLPFGIASAVHGITKLWKPITRFLNAQGIRNTIYIDDGRLLAASESSAQVFGTIAYNTITQAGWAIETSKSDKITSAAREKNYLGFTLDTGKMQIWAPEAKLRKAESMIQEILQRSHIPPKHLAKILGIIISLEPSHGMVSRVATRSGYLALAEHTSSLGWTGLVTLPSGLHREFQFFMENIRKLNGSPMRSKQREIRLEMIIKNPVAKTWSLPYHKKSDFTFVSDASDTKVFVYNLESQQETVLETNFTQEQQGWASGARELLGLVFTLRQWKNQGNMRNVNIYWITDSENMVSFINKGSRKPRIQDLVFEVTILTSEMGIKIEPIHVLRQDPRIELADAGSRRPDTDNWSVDAWSFETIQHLVGEPFDTDLFADCNNHRTQRFYSLFYSEGTSGIDAFAQDWSKLGNLWICPPVGQLINIHMRITRSKCKGVLLAPAWETSSFLHFLMTSDTIPAHPYTLLWKWRPYIIQNENAKNTALFGEVPFFFVALHFDNTEVRN